MLAISLGSVFSENVSEVFLTHVVTSKYTLSGVDGVGFEFFVVGGVLHDHDLVSVALSCIKLSTQNLREDHLGGEWHQSEVRTALLDSESEQETHDLLKFAERALIHALGTTSSHYGKGTICKSDSCLKMQACHLVVVLGPSETLRHRGRVLLSHISELPVHEIHDSRMNVKISIEEESENSLVLPIARNDSVVAVV